jgi:hypothetical protein
VVSGITEPLLVRGNIKISNWWKANGMMPARIEPAFNDGSMVAVPIWKPLFWPAAEDQRPNPAHTNWRRRPESGGYAESMIDVHIPESILTMPPQCTPRLKNPTLVGEDPPQGAYALNEFYWVQVEPGDFAQNAQCGDFLLLVGLHVIQKNNGRWLWSTFWWDKEPPAKFSTKGLGEFEHTPGPNPDAWKNYAMDASYANNVPIFNPWKEAEGPTSNCAQCHEHALVPFDRNVPDNIAMPKPVPEKSLSFDFIFAPAVTN